MTTLLKISQQTIWQLVGKAVTSISTLIILSILSRVYGESGIGVYTLTLTYLGLFVLSIDLGVNAYLLRYFLGDTFTAKWQRLFGLRLALVVLLTLASLLIITLWPQSQQEFKDTVLIGTFTFWGVAIFVTANVIFQAKQRYDLHALILSISMIMVTGLVAVLAQQRVNISTIILGQLLGWTVAGVLSVVVVKKYITAVVPIFDLKFAASVFRKTWPISLTLVLNTVYFRSDSFILGFYKSFTEVGIYNLAYQLFQSVLVLPTFITNSYYPIMLKDLTKGKQLFKNNLIKVAMVMLLIAVVGTLLTYLLAPFVVSFISGGSGFSGSILSLKILSLSLPAFFLSALMMWSLITLGRYKAVLLVYSFGFFLNILLNLIFIPQYSFVAAASITAASEYLILILQVVILIPLVKK